MFSTKIRKILSGIMITGDILLGAVFFADLLSGYDTTVDLVVLGFLAIDALLSIDYISKLTKEEKEALEAERKKKYQKSRKENAERRLDQEMAKDISSATEALDYEEEMDPDELAELLQNQQNVSKKQQR